MGKIDRLLDFGNSRRGKIIAWSMSIGFALVFFIGLGMTTAGATTPNISSITVVANNVFHGTVSDAEGGGDRTGWHLTLTELETPLTIMTTPLVSGAHVRLSTASDLITIRDTTILPGGSTFIRINMVGGGFEFHDPDPHMNVDRIQILVECSNRVTNIFVRIVLTEHAARLNAWLERNPKNPYDWQPTEFLWAQEFERGINDPRDQPVMYRVRVQFTIFGHVLFDSVNYIGRERERFNEPVDLDGRNLPIGLFYEHMGEGTGLVTATGFTEDVTVPFRLSLNYNGRTWGTDFAINVRAEGRHP